jgi:hypothetical protein
MKSPVALSAMIDVETPLKPASQVYSDRTYTRRPAGDHWLVRVPLQSDSCIGCARPSASNRRRSTTFPLLIDSCSTPEEPARGTTQVVDVAGALGLVASLRQHPSQGSQRGSSAD